MSASAAAQLASLRTRFPDWQIIRTRCGTLIARHQLTRVLVQAGQLSRLESLLREYSLTDPADPTGSRCPAPQGNAVA
jgi:hypothetical protein